MYEQQSFLYKSVLQPSPLEILPSGNQYGLRANLHAECSSLKLYFSAQIEFLKHNEVKDCVC